MDSAHSIRAALARVSQLREDLKQNQPLYEATVAIKRFQAKRFAGTYSDLMASPEFAAPTRFFLEELYSERDYSKRDDEFSRIAGGLQRFFPKHVVNTAVELARLHALSEELDREMAQQWMRGAALMPNCNAARYVHSWVQLDRGLDRERQLQLVLTIGVDLDRLTRVPGLRTLLRMMRRPASRAGLSALQSFLELGFDTFAQMSKKNSQTNFFLQTIEQRERLWIERLSNGPIEQVTKDLEDCVANID